MVYRAGGLLVYIAGGVNGGANNGMPLVRPSCKQCHAKGLLWSHHLNTKQWAAFAECHRMIEEEISDPACIPASRTLSAPCELWLCAPSQPFLLKSLSCFRDGWYHTTTWLAVLGIFGFNGRRMVGRVGGYDVAWPTSSGEVRCCGCRAVTVPRPRRG